MSGQNSLDINLAPFIMHGRAYKVLGSIADDDARSAVLEPFTVMAYDPTNKVWTPYIDVTATDGTQYPRGIYLGPQRSVAEMQAGPITNQVFLIGDALVDENQLVFDEDTVAKDDIITAPTSLALDVEGALRLLSIFLSGSVDVDAYENA